MGHLETSPFKILIVDDEPNIRSGMARGLKAADVVIDTAANGQEATQLLRSNTYHLMIADLRLPGGISGLDLVSVAKEQSPEITVIVITAHGSVESAVEAMKLGAFDFIPKPIDLEVIRVFVQKARERMQLLQENRALKAQLAAAGDIEGMIAASQEMKTLLQLIRQVAVTDATVLIRGESGTGKELIARGLHNLSPRANARFVPVNLGALPETLLESELFGYEKGAFSGAMRQKPGCFELAHGGTLFLDEVTEMSSRTQVDLLRILETREFTRLGGETVLQTDARIVAATNREIESLISSGNFREDLYYRLNVVPVEVPPLRQRTDDLPLLVNHFLKLFSKRYQMPVKTISNEALEVLMAYNWPGNIRQLRNVIERLSVTATQEVITADMIPIELRRRQKPESSESLAAVIEKAEIEAIKKVLAECEGHREKTAKRLDISVRTLHYKMNRFELY